VDVSLIQYRGGATDYTSVLTAQQAKITEDRRLTTIRGNLTLNVVALYKALGGGWELRTTDDFVPTPTQAEMQERTWWGGMLDTAEQTEDVDAAKSDLETEDGSGTRRWRWWWPEW